MGVTVKLNKKKLDALRVLVPVRVLSIMNQQVEGGAQLAKGLAPVDTGRLREGIDALPGEHRGSTITAKLVSRTPYSAFVEFGSARGAPAQPFFMPAVESIRSGLISSLKKAVE